MRIMIDPPAGVDNFTLHIMHAKTNSDNEPDLDGESNSLMSNLAFVSGPGHTQMRPLTDQQSSRIELARVIVAAAITWLTFKIKMESVRDEYFSKKLPNNRKNADRKNSIAEAVAPETELQDGISYEDLVVGLLGPPEQGENVTINVQLYYNGLAIKSFWDTITASGIMLAAAEGKGGSSQQVTIDSDSAGTNGKNSDGNISIMYGQINPIFEAISLSGLNMPGVLTGMRFGGKRRITLPSKYAFGDAGYAPYIGSGGKVIVDVTMVPSTTTT